MQKEMTFMAACKDFFGLKEGQTAVQFLQETKQLSPTDREEIRAGLKANGYIITGA